MPRIRKLTLSVQEQAELEFIRDKSPRAYLRERAAALLKIASGLSANRVALTGLLVKRSPDTVYEWMNRYESEGVAGLSIRKGRGRRAAYFP